MPVASDLHETLTAVASALAPARDHWWVIGSAAVVLHLGEPTPVHDVDVLLSPADAQRLLPSFGLAPVPGAAHPRFRSALFATWRAHPLPVEFMAGFDVHDGQKWRSVRLHWREPIAVGAAELFVPSRDELRALLQQFGRSKDVARAARLGRVISHCRRSPAPQSAPRSRLRVCRCR